MIHYVLSVHCYTCVLDSDLRISSGTNPWAFSRGIKESFNIHRSPLVWVFQPIVLKSGGGEVLPPALIVLLGYAVGCSAQSPSWELSFRTFTFDFIQGKTVRKSPLSAWFTSFSYGIPCLIWLRRVLITGNNRHQEAIMFGFLFLWRKGIAKRNWHGRRQRWRLTVGTMAGPIRPSEKTMVTRSTCSSVTSRCAELLKKMKESSERRFSGTDAEKCQKC